MPAQIWLAGGGHVFLFSSQCEHSGLYSQRLVRNLRLSGQNSQNTPWATNMVAMDHTSQDTRTLACSITWFLTINTCSILYIYDFYTHYHCTVNAQFVFSVLVLLTFASLLTFMVCLGPGYLVCASLDPFCDPDLASCIGFVYLEFH